MDDASKLISLQREFDDFMESSKELEYELQQELGHAENKVDDLTRKNQQAQEKATSLQLQLQESSRAVGALQSELQRTKEQNADLDKKSKSLELENDSLLDRVRILEATEADLIGKAEAAQESTIFLQGEIEEYKDQVKSKERDLKKELTTLMAEHVTIIDALEAENKDLNARLAESEQQNGELCEELERGGDDLMAAATLSNALKEEVAALKSQLTAAPPETSTASAELEAEIADLREQLDKAKRELKEQTLQNNENQDQVLELCTELETANEGLIEASTEAATLKADLATKDEVIAAHAQRVEGIQTELAQARAAGEESMRAVEKEISTLREELAAKCASVAALEADLAVAASGSEVALQEVRAELVAANNAAESRVAELEVELRQLTAQLAAAVEDAEARSSQETENESVRRQLEETQVNVSALTEELSQARTAADESTRALKNEISSLEAELAVRTSRVAALEADLAAVSNGSDQAIVEARAELTTAKEAAASKVAELVVQLGRLKEEVTAAEKEAEFQDNQIKLVRSQNEALCQKLEEAGVEADCLKADLATKDEVIAAHAQRVEGIQTELAQARAAGEESMRAVEKEISALREELAAKCTSVAALEADLAAVANGSDQAIVEARAELMSAKEAAADKVAEAEAELTVANTALTALQSEVASLKQDLLKSEAASQEVLLELKQVREGSEQRGALERDVASLQQRVAEMEVEATDSAEELKRSSASCVEKSEQCLSLEQDISVLQKELEEAISKITVLESTVQGYSNAQSERSVEQDRNVSELTAKLEASERDGMKLTEQLQLGEANYESLNAQYDDLLTSLETAKSTVRDLEIDNSTLTTTIRELKAKEQQDSLADIPEGGTTPRKAARRLSRTSDASELTTSSLRRESSSVEHLAVSPRTDIKLSRGHSNISVSALPSGKYELPVSVEESMAALRAQQKVNEQFLLDPVGSVQVSAMAALDSDDIDVLKKEVDELLHRYLALKASNAALLQKMQSLKGNIQVCCRTRPPLEPELVHNARICVDTSSDNELAWYDKRAEVWKSFAFDKVWPMDAMQADIFADVEPLALSVVDGYNACILAFGQTGSGKTWTMNGYGDQYGVSYRTLHKIFERLHFRKSQSLLEKERIKNLRNRRRSSTTGSVDGIGNHVEKIALVDDADKEECEDEDISTPAFEFTVSVGMLEIYNEMVRDLLCPAADGHEGHGLDIRQTAEGGVGVPGLTTENVHGIDDVMSVFARGSANRATITTNLNEHSSRSHSILLVDVTTCVHGSAPVVGKLYLVDLAGSERVEKSGVTGAAMKEAQHINKSLSALGDVMEALDSKAKHVPYRNSKLTYLLQDSLGGHARTMMIVTICPTEDSSDESLFALQFATRVRRIQLGAAHKNVSSKNLEESLKALKTELKEVKRKKTRLEETYNDVKKEQKKTTDKATSQLEIKLRALEDMKKAADLQIQTLQKSNADLTAKLQDERQGRATIAHELDVASKSMKKTHEQVKTLTREKEHVVERLKEKEREISVATMSEALAEKKGGPSASRIGVARGTKRPSITTQSDAKGTTNRQASTDGSHGQEVGKRGSPVETVRRSGSDESGSPGSSITRLIKEEALSGSSYAEKESSGVDDSFSATPPPKKSNIPRVPTRRASERSVDTASVCSNSSQHIPRYLQATKASSSHHGTSLSSTADSVDSGKKAASGIPSARPVTRSRAAASAVEEPSTTASSRSQEAMLKHQERLKRKRDQIAPGGMRK